MTPLTTFFSRLGVLALFIYTGYGAAMQIHWTSANDEAPITGASSFPAYGKAEQRSGSALVGSHFCH